MYQAINDNLICKIPERKTDSGIILSKQEQGQTYELLVVATTENTQELEGKTVYVQHRIVAANKLPDGEHVAVPLSDVLAVA